MHRNQWTPLLAKLQVERKGVECAGEYPDRDAARRGRLNIAKLSEVLRGTLDRDRFPLSPRIRLLRIILEKLGIRPILATPRT